MYKFESVIVKKAMFKDAHDIATVDVQARLDEGYKRGWKLVSCQESNFNNNGLIFYLVWDTEK